ncbi:MAG: ATP-binding protein [Phycisphaerae bacterium]|nr:ATP-binding protein [Phycisphaerae bacterium]
MVISSNLKEARQLEEQLLRDVARFGYEEADAFAIKLALEEGLVNAIKHGNKYDQKKTVRVVSQIDEHEAAFTITDEGAGFRLTDVPDPTADENLERPCGRGLMLIRAFMDEVSYNETGNQVRLVKRRTRLDT